MSTLILHLPSSPPGPATLYPFTLTVDGHTVVQHAVSSLEQLPTPARPGAEVVAMVPAQALSWHWVEWPSGLAISSASPRLRSVLEGLLEERLLDEPAQMHFCLSPDAGSAPACWVAACDRTWLRQHLAALEAAGQPVSRIVPEMAPAPATDAPQLQVLGTPEDAWLLANGQGPHAGLVCLPFSPDTLRMVLQNPAGAAPGTASLRADPAVAALAEKTYGHPVALCSAAQRALEAARGAWDLAQFDLANGHRTRALRQLGAGLGAFLHAPQWRAGRWALALLVIVQLAALNAVAWQERRALQAKHNSIRSALTQTFPHIRVVVDAPAQMERELYLLRQTTGSVSARDFEPLLAATGAALPPGVVPTQVNYTAGELQLKGLALSAPQREELSQRLQAQGMAVSPGEPLVVRPRGTP